MTKVIDGYKSEYKKVMANKGLRGGTLSHQKLLTFIKPWNADQPFIFRKYTADDFKRINFDALHFDYAGLDKEILINEIDSEYEDTLSMSRENENSSDEEWAKETVEEKDYFGNSSDNDIVNTLINESVKGNSSKEKGKNKLKKTLSKEEVDSSDDNLEILFVKEDYGSNVINQIIGEIKKDNDTFIVEKRKSFLKETSVQSKRKKVDLTAKEGVRKSARNVVVAKNNAVAAEKQIYLLPISRNVAEKVVVAAEKVDVDAEKIVVAAEKVVVAAEKDVVETDGVTLEEALVEKDIFTFNHGTNIYLENGSNLGNDIEHCFMMCSDDEIKKERILYYNYDVGNNIDRFNSPSNSNIYFSVV